MTYGKLAPLAAFALLAACSSGEDEPADPPAATQAATEQPTPLDTPADPDRAFRYTSVADCKVLESNPEEAGYFRYECPGEGGYKLQVIESDLRQTAQVIAPGGRGTALNLSAVTGGGFSTLGRNVEWRGVEKEGVFVPDALILRHEVVTDPEGRDTISYLVAVKLTGTPCVVARIGPETNQNVSARAAADAGGACL